MYKDKKQLFIQAVETASLKLGLEDIIIKFKSSDYSSNNKDIIARFKPDFFCIIVNKNWLIQEHELNIIQCAFHETRHAYQYACLLFTDQMNIDVDKKTLDLWKIEFEKYINPNKNNIFDYENQSVEKDADQFSLNFMKELKII